MPLIAADQTTGELIDATDNPHGIRLATCPDPTCRSDVHYVKESIDGRMPHWRHSVHSDCPHSTAHHNDPITRWHIGWQQRCTDLHRREVSVTSPTGERGRADILTKDQWAIEIQHSAITERQIGRRERVHQGRVLWLFDAASPERYGEAQLINDQFTWTSTPGHHRATTKGWVAVDIGLNQIVILPRSAEHRGGDLIVPRTKIKQYDYQTFTDLYINADHTPLTPPDWHTPTSGGTSRTHASSYDLTCNYSGTSERVRPTPTEPPVPCDTCGQPLRYRPPGRTTCAACSPIKTINAGSHH